MPNRINEIVLTFAKQVKEILGDWYLRRNAKYKNLSKEPIEVASLYITKEDSYEYVKSLKNERRILK